jgi:vancomycin permeability regulator SanA
LKIIKSYLRYLIIAIIALFIARALLIIHEGLSDKIEKADVALIFGSKLENNREISKQLKAGLNGGIKIYRLGLVKKLLVSGDKEKEGLNEAEAMKKYLISQDIPPGDIISDDLGYSTYESAINCRAIMEFYNYKSVLIISQYFHISRAKLALKKAGAEKIYSTHVPYYEFKDIFLLFKEVFAYYYYSMRTFYFIKYIAH